MAEPGLNPVRLAEKVHIPASHLCTYVHEPWPNFKSPVFPRIFAVFGLGKGKEPGPDRRKPAGALVPGLRPGLQPRPPNPAVCPGDTAAEARNCSDDRRAAGFERFFRESGKALQNRKRGSARRYRR